MRPSRTASAADTRPKAFPSGPSAPATGRGAGAASGTGPSVPGRGGPDETGESTSALPTPVEPDEERGIGRLVQGVSDTPVRVFYGIGAAVATAALIFVIFLLFSGDQPPDPVAQQPARVRIAATASPPSSPTPSPIVLPKVPAAKIPAPLAGTPSVVIGLVTDPKARITYNRLGAPWQSAAGTSFSRAQRIGTFDEPYTFIASARLPGAAPKSLATEADLRKVAASAVRWSIRNYHPEGSVVTWTGSQPLATGRGWVLSYRVRYEIEGKKRTSQAALAIVDTGARKPSMLLVTIADGNKARYPDIAALMSSVRAY